MFVFVVLCMMLCLIRFFCLIHFETPFSVAYLILDWVLMPFVILFFVVYGLGSIADRVFGYFGRELGSRDLLIDTVGNFLEKHFLRLPNE